MHLLHGLCSGGQNIRLIAKDRRSGLETQTLQYGNNPSAELEFALKNWRVLGYSTLHLEHRLTRVTLE